MANGLTKGLLIGGLIGAGIALIYAPKSGIELPRDVTRRAKGLKTDMGRYVKRLRKSSVELLDRALETGEAAVEAVTGRIEAHDAGRKESAGRTRAH
jgi:gas vesicle protein